MSCRMCEHVHLNFVFVFGQNTRNNIFTVADLRSLEYYPRGTNQVVSVGCAQDTKALKMADNKADGRVLLPGDVSEPAS